MMRQILGKAVSEPLVHFLGIGLVLFVLSLIFRPEVEDPRLIRIDAGVQQHLATLFRNDRERLPSAEEMDELVEVFIRNETLYREARALKLDDGDEMMRERLAQRMRLMLYSGISVDDPTEDQLRAWFEDRIDQFGTPALLTVEIIGLDGEKAEAQEIAATALAREAAGDPMRSPEVTLVAFKRRPLNQLERLFGTDFMDSIQALDLGVWTAVESPRGWQVARLVEMTDPVPPSFEQVAEDIRGRWREERKQTEARAALAALMETYPVERPPYVDGVLADPSDTGTAKAATE